MKFYLQLKKQFTLLLCIGMLITANVVNAQERVISGVVKDASDQSVLPGVSVQIKGTSTGTITDFDGHFKLSLNPQAEVVVFSYIGYSPQEVTIGTQTEFTVNLEQDVEQLEEVIVVGYQVQKKSVVTGAIASVKADDITQTPVQNAAQSLQGKTPGVLVAPVSGQPGAGIDIRVRGTGSNGSNTPLYVVDGVQMDNINFLNPNDIESIEVLKDAASAAIYGSRGANGVVLVSTKKGKAGRTIVSYDGYYGIQEAWRQAPVMNAREYMTFHNEGSINAGGAPRFTQDEINSNTVDTDWQDEMFKQAPIQSHTVQMSGGTESSQFLASVGYFGQQGIVAPEKSNFDRYSIRLNSSHKISQYFKAGSNITFSREEKEGINEQNQFGGVLQNALLHDPLTPVWEDDPTKIQEYDTYAVKPANKDGRYYGISEQGLREVVNPMARINNTYSDDASNKFLGNVFLEVTPGIKGLRFKTDFGVDIGNWSNRGYNPEAYYNNVNQVATSGINQAAGSYLAFQWENVLTYEKKIGDHKVDALLGTTTRNGSGTSVGASRNNLQIPGWQYAWVSNGADDETQKGYGGQDWQHRLVSFFGKVGYNYKEKYLVSFTARYDGSSNFGPNNKFGFFPSVQAGWILSQEDFLKNNDVVNFLKLRGSWGRVGNENIGAFGYLELFGQTPSYPFGTTQVMVPGYAITSMSNPDLKWEQAQEVDLGIDMGFLDDKVTATVDVYSRERQNLLGVLPVPGFTGVGGPNYNLGTVRNQGIEASLTYSKRDGDFHFDVTVNGSYNDNKVMEVANGDGKIYGPGLFQTEGQLMMEEGYSLPYFYGFKTDGIFQNQGEIDAHANEGSPIQPDAQPGDIRYVDVNGDGVIDQNDRTNIGSPVHSWMYGLNVRMDYKGFDFSMFWQGQAGGSLVNGTLRPDLRQAENYPSRYLNRWTGEGTTNSFPRFTYDDRNQNLTRMNDMVHVEDASYLRLKNLQIGYTLPQKVSKKVGMSKLRMYVSGNNLLTFTNYTGMDPEVAHGGAWVGYDNGSYPQARAYLFGLNVTF
ncbi:SusC/RagA family TonB-linked outer membrane protein [Flammeovirga agarivorans]|uniref:TonB-dependent receptor n=1 Tax=Flammeovirga agarivorans TaxID=2726742 RepID=A0A7X8SHG4_9BACT|nr:TonB-dependent receptor [Flammeovirga agarivorans]NLR90328.1 TonB-dependent receptor [Flammeovirga agarivorans]